MVGKGMWGRNRHSSRPSGGARGTELSLYLSQFTTNATAEKTWRKKVSLVWQFSLTAATTVGDAGDDGGRLRGGLTAANPPMTNRMLLLDCLPHRILANVPSHK